MEGMIEEAIGNFTNEGGGKRVVVLMDGVDFMMAALGLGAVEILGMIGRIREVGFCFYTSRLSLQYMFYHLLVELFRNDSSKHFLVLLFPMDACQKQTKQEEMHDCLTISA